jgi:putative tricarboxylic transport membrane protein
MSDPHRNPGRRHFVRSPQNFVAGLALIGAAAFAFWAVSDLAPGTLRVMGPSMLPRSIAVLIGVAGLVLVVAGMLADGEPLERWHLRGPLFICAGLILFALTIRNVGFVIAGPLAMIVCGFATPEVRKAELLVFAAAMTAFCLLLFVYLLEQSIPVLRIPGTAIQY